MYFILPVDLVDPTHSACYLPSQAFPVLICTHSVHTKCVLFVVKFTFGVYVYKTHAKKGKAWELYYLMTQVLSQHGTLTCSMYYPFLLMHTHLDLF